jgi:Tfp pilus assembly protein PilP
MFVERVEAGGVFGVSDGEIVGVNDEEFRVRRVAEAFGDGLGLS